MISIKSDKENNEFTKKIHNIMFLYSNNIRFSLSWVLCSYIILIFILNTFDSDFKKYF